MPTFTSLKDWFSPNPDPNQIPPIRPDAVPVPAEEPFRPVRQSNGFTSRVLIVVGIVTFVGLLLFFLWASRSILLLGFGVVLMAVLLRAVGKLICKISSRIPMKAAVGLATVLLLGALVGFGMLAAPRISEQMSTLTSEIPASIQKIKSQLNATQWGQVVLKQLEEDMPSPSLSRVTGIVGGTLGVITNAVVIFVAGLFLALDPGLYVNGLARLFPVSRRQRAREVVASVADRLESWLLGQFIAMFAVGVLTWVGLAALGMPLAMVLAVIAFVFDFVPFIGPLIAAVPAVLLAVLQGPQMVLYVALVYLAVQQVESYLVAPLVQQHTVSVPPTLLLLTALLGGVLFGLPGTIIAMPALVVLITLIKELYVKDTLGDHTEEAK
ncbi:AI-2E family transporter [Hymenobacter sp. B1770]|uniref:AI-2E family transporter n=1 Tax=Hymenobacter sp. B1770 TaxID=1718788 RepID=UPI003CF790B7